MDIYEAVKNRHSCRSFKSDPVSEETVRKIVDYATKAPSAGNLQPWFFYVIRDEETKAMIVKAANDQHFIIHAPYLIVVTADYAILERYYGERGKRLYVIQDCAAAIQNLMLAAVAEGLATCWIGAFNDVEVSKILGLPLDEKPQAIIPLGFQDKEPKLTPRKPIDEVMKFI